MIHPAVGRFFEKYLLYIEIVLLSATTIGFLMIQQGNPGGGQFIMIALTLLSMTYFLAGTPQSRFPFFKKQPVQSQGFLSTLTKEVIPNAGWIGCATAIIGALFFFLHLHGADQMLFISSLVLMVATVIMGITLLVKPDMSPLYLPILFRVVPLALLSIYLFMNAPALNSSPI